MSVSISFDEETRQDILNKLKANRLKHFPTKQTSLMVQLIKRYAKELTFDGVTLFFNAHMTWSTLLQIEALIASGAVLTIACGPSSIAHGPVITFLDNLGIKVFQSKHDLLSTHYDLAIDSCGGVVDFNLDLKYGVVELTHTGIQKFKNYEKRKFPVVSIDDSEIKMIETYLGTSNGFIRAFESALKADISNQTFTIFGYGKVGRGLANILKLKGGLVHIVETDSQALSNASQDGFHAIDLSKKERVIASLKNSFCIITATGVHSIMSNFDKTCTENSIRINMGAQDEWGENYADSEVLNSKSALNFMLKHPTFLEFLDPVFYAQLLGAEYLYKANDTIQDNKIMTLPAEKQLHILTSWIKHHYPVDNSEKYNLEDYIKLIEHIPGYAFIKDKNLVYRACNENFAKACGVNTISNVIGKSDHDMPWDPSESSLYRFGDIQVLNGKSLINMEETQKIASGEIIHVVASKVPIYDDKQNINGILCIYQDISFFNKKLNLLKAEQAKINREFNYLRLSIESISENISEMIHDFTSNFFDVVDKRVDRSQSDMIFDKLERINNKCVDLSRLAKKQLIDV